MNALIVGAGNIGLGFLGHLLWKSGQFSITFLETRSDRVDVLNRERAYTVVTVSNNGFSEEMVGPVRAISITDTDAAVKAIVDADLILTAVGKTNLVHVAPCLKVSLNSVRRTIDRAGLMKKRSIFKRYHPHVERPKPEKPGDLVQLDTIHRMIDEKKRLYIFVLLDVHSRWVYAKAYAKMNSALMVAFVHEAQQASPFHFAILQSDHGPEFGAWFVEQVKKSHRYTRIGKPNDNAHIERFNRTLQEECLDHLPDDVSVINGALKKYLRYYNNERLHMGISLKTPMQIIQNRFQAIG